MELQGAQLRLVSARPELVANYYSTEPEKAALRFDLLLASAPMTLSSRIAALTGPDRAVDAEKLHILQHSLGLTYGDTMYRNHFCTGEGTVDWPHCLALVEMGLMTRRKGNQITGGDDVFYVTDDGKQVAMQARGL